MTNGAPVNNPPLPPGAPGHHPVLILAPDGRATLDATSVRLLVRLGNAAKRTSFRAFLNNREVTGLFARANPLACTMTTCDLSAVVTPLDGLLPGRNELRVEVRGSNSSQIFFTQ